MFTAVCVCVCVCVCLCVCVTHHPQMESDGGPVAVPHHPHSIVSEGTRVGVPTCPKVGEDNHTIFVHVHAI